MHKNQLQELAQRSCFNLPSYACVRQGPDHSPRFKASVNFNGEVFEGPGDCTTLRQAEHAAAEVALTSLSSRWRSRSLAARVLDETGVYKNLLQETAHRAGLKLPVYTVVRSGPGHQPVFSCTVEIAGMSFAGEPAKTKKQVEKNAAMAAWSALKQMPDLDWLMPQQEITEEKEPVEAAAGRLLSSFKPRDQQQQRRGTVLGSSSSSSASHNSSNWYGPQWRSQSPAPSDGFAPYSARAHQKQSSFSAQGPKILPPLPSATASQESFSSMGNKSSVNPSLPAQLRNRPQLEELQKDVDDSERSDSKGKALEKDDREWVMAKLQARANQQQSSAGLIGPSPSQFSSRPFRPPLVTGRNHPAMPMPRITGRNPPAMPMPRMMAGGGYRAPGIAPAVHIRQMIPVCAAPPARPAVNTTAHKKQPEEEISGATSKLNKLEI